MKNKIYIGTGLQRQNIREIEGKLTEIAGEEYYVIQNYDQMMPFFLTVVSNSDKWMYLSSKGSLTAGRKNPDQALFPYYTDDKIHDSGEITGSKTILLVTGMGKTFLWEPFSENHDGLYNIERNLYKNTSGNKIIFEEHNLDLKLTFRYSWASSECYGWVRESSLVNHGDTCEIELVDGLQNILPWGVNLNMQSMKSTLVDAYKKSELITDTSLALFRLSSIPVDRAEPSEALKTNIVWSAGLKNPKYLLSNQQLKKFSRGEDLQTEKEKRGIKGAYFVCSGFSLKHGEKENWFIVAEVAIDASAFVKLIDDLKDESTLLKNLLNDIERGSKQLENLVAKADGIQLTGDRLNEKRHFSNTLFNIMRGGIPHKGYIIEKTDFQKHLIHFNRPLASELDIWINSLPEKINYSQLLSKAEGMGNPDLIRLSLEYLPLMFSRRHGDPSRPWNIFDIKLKNNDGTPSLYYQGNWRDIFQNWEALAMSYPLFVQGMIAKFLNASTIDGYNPYRITSDGIDWELLDPSDPWSNIGYWGDHQIIYLEKLLELSERFFPGNLEKWMLLPIFTYANVPYKHKPYGQLLENPRDTIEFDLQRHEKIEKLENKTGADGKLIMLGDEILKVNFTEKALVPLLSKISNFIPGAGIWINTQRPEWNDANNALVGSGTSMVTLYYMRRYVSFLIGLFEKTKSEKWPVLSEVWEFFKGIDQIVTQNLNLAKIEISGIEQKQLLDKFGLEGSRFRVKVYKGLSGETKHIMKEELIAFMIKVKQFIDSSIVSNQRPDGLYHAYNLISFKGEEISVRNLSEMLEGQVAVLSSGALKPKVAAELLNSLRKSDLYRPDQRSYMLYPDKQLPWFPDKNNLTSSQINRSKLLQELLLNANKQIVVKDIHGICHFNGIINNAETLLKSLNELPGKYQTLVNKETSLILEIYEEVFDHQSFTGRSGSFYKYEGLGCIYWHMVSKLLLAFGENIRFAQKIGEDEAVIDELKKHYAEIREGIGSHKSPAEYGAFPTDPYSHTPSMAGVQQPGMTGQVKEDLLSRWMEMGLEVENGEIRFYPYNIDKIEFTESHSLISALRFQSCFDVEIPQDEKYLAYTFCGVPVFCIPGEENKLDVFTKEGKISMNNELRVNQELSKMVFSRSGDVMLIRLTFKPLKS